MESSFCFPSNFPPPSVKDTFVLLRENICDACWYRGQRHEQLATTRMPSSIDRWQGHYADADLGSGWLEQQCFYQVAAEG